MTDKETNQLADDATAPAQPVRKPWSKPVLTIRSIEEVTHGTLANTNPDGPGSFFS